ncbi:hypothetical protein GCM10027425_06670 [Alteromonas gracilis]
MVIVAGHLIVDPDQRAAYLAGCWEVVEQARQTPGCLDFVLAADPLDPARIHVHERWETREAVEAFRSGPGGEQATAIRAASVSEYDVTGERSLS